jgi:hypothetical protein
MISGVSMARIIGTNPKGANVDLWCNGGRIRAATPVLYTEICQDYLGDLIPTSTSGTQSLGTASLPWLSLYSGTVVAGSGGVITSAPITLASYTTTQFASLPGIVGGLAYNSTLNKLEYSTTTTTGYWTPY